MITCQVRRHSSTRELSEKDGAHPSFAETRLAEGKLQFDLWGVKPAEDAHWNALRERILQHGVRNSLLIVIAPTATIASIVGCYECIEPQISNLFKRETLSGEFLQINRYLVAELKDLGLWNEEMRMRLKLAEGSVQQIEALPDDLKLIYRTVWEVPMRGLIDMARDRNAYIDQSQSLNLFSDSPNIGKLSSMYMYAWKNGLKTTYYIRTRPATPITLYSTSTSTLTRPRRGSTFHINFMRKLYTYSSISLCWTIMFPIQRNVLVPLPPLKISLLSRRRRTSA